MNANRSQAGFTVLELLIVIVIFSMIVIMLTSGQRFAVRAWATQENQIQRQGDVGAVQNAIRTLLVAGRGFQGDDQSLTWTGPLPRGLNKAGLFDISLLFDDDRLYIAYKPHFAGPTPKVEAERAVLAKDVTDVRLAYFAAGDGAAEGWSKSVAKDKKPALIRIGVKLAQGRWPPLVVAPMLDSAPVAPAAPQPPPPGPGAVGAPAPQTAN